ncbi:thioredoxin [Microseira wollei]|uniref:Thioredoxin n=1 Tax=Microseira wollei NIES-4236 TaxID=2530354 RepID=A0AAV3XA91_9CYAN|nr:thioredoxin [Microseira wollei]GET38308.1 thioredoxin [Microseira wollei NIES-4236]
MATKQEFNSFEEMLASSDLPVLVDFYATWCGPCQMMAKILEQVSAQMSGKLKIVKIDTDKYEQLAVDHRIYALPTLVLFKNGEAVDRIEGVMQTADLIQRLQSLL